MRYVKQLFTLTLIVVASAQPAFAAEATCDNDISYYIFSWPISEGCGDRPRGGSSKGAEVEISNDVHKGWLTIQNPKLSKFEKDRAAILAIAGGYKVDFNFLETVGYTHSFERDRPYHSWGTEYVYVVEDRENFISLQHIMVMYFKQDDGTISEPFVMKHWRQDWTYEDNSLLEYQHSNIWKNHVVDSSLSKGAWSQAVFQVDDSPRYESIGRWQHNASFSTWLSGTTRRPLPRRESSVRQDYDVLEGFNRHTVTRTGWVQEEENWKLSLDVNGQPDSENPYVSKELGVARYQLSANVDFTPGDKYINETQEFWQAVRAYWNVTISSNDTISLKRTVDGQPLFMPMFEAATVERDKKEVEKFVKKTISKYRR